MIRIGLFLFLSGILGCSVGCLSNMHREDVYAVIRQDPGLSQQLASDDDRWWGQVLSRPDLIPLIQTQIMETTNSSDRNCYILLLWKIGSLQSEASLVEVAREAFGTQNWPDDDLSALLHWLGRSGKTAGLFLNRLDVNRLAGRKEEEQLVSYVRAFAKRCVQRGNQQMRFLSAVYSSSQTDTQPDRVRLLTALGSVIAGKSPVGMVAMTYYLEDHMVKRIDIGGFGVRIYSSINGGDCGLAVVWEGSDENGNRFQLTPQEYRMLRDLPDSTSPTTNSPPSPPPPPSAP